ncbi:hypothetical protein [uncultured Draconibacterium sp.]|uniref:hypothetical protein n=1 Tax=uncultured Draconibacterium sp. TaxID=1573823 RepID=UPI0029C86301|nr:hypothetical protein [uncultured Draconibacterium sp.]
MKLLLYSNTIEKRIPGNADLYIESFMKKIQWKLKELEARSEVKINTIEFERTVRNTTHSGENKREALKILREGFVRIEKNGSNKIQIFWEVKLDILLFLSIMVGLIIGLIVGFIDSGIVLSIITGLLFSIMVYFIGYSVIKIKIDRIVETSV